MKNKIILAAIAFLLVGVQNLSAQTTREHWKDINYLTLYEPMHASQCKTLYILPVDDSKADYFKDSREKTMQNVKNSRAQFRPTIQKDIKKAYKKLNVQLVDAMPAELKADELALSLTFTEYNLGSAALRGWVGGGQAGFTLAGEFYGGGNKKIVTFNQRHKTGIFDPNKYEKIIKKLNSRFSEDIVVIIKELDKER